MDILTRLQNLPPSKFHYRLLVLVGIGWLFDAMDTGLVSFILPELGKDWSLAPAQLGWIVSISFVGMALGAVISGWFADRFGRKTVFAGTMAVLRVSVFFRRSWSAQRWPMMCCRDGRRSRATPSPRARTCSASGGRGRP